MMVITSKQRALLIATTFFFWATFHSTAGSLSAEAEELARPEKVVRFKVIDTAAIRDIALHYYFQQDIVVEYARWGQLNLLRDVLYATYDFNDDGEPEIIFVLNHSIGCSNGGCSTDILRKVPTGWRIIFGGGTFVTHIPDDFRVLPETDNGYRRFTSGGIVHKWRGPQIQQYWSDATYEER